ncbi:DUF2568 domain-containing protein [Bacillus sp. HMF5848]|uniref:YrdB family protein n=1 Tax=Bacillus sp. HMF5848 TaxID=2495421 RepID=UPI000F79D26D|nr:YrdB family protein [Bacillus sp. HMF5848]RSK25922.1 DUF2568 domain-containing protein [Bacillus sp. HMF5848]
MMMLNLTLRFLLELFALTALGYWGFQIGQSPISKVTLAIVFPVLVAVVWGTFGSPAAPFRLSGSARLLLEITINGLATIGLYITGHPLLASIFAVVVVINRVLMHIWEQ